MSNFTLPILTQFSGNKPAEKVTIKLSKLGANLEVQIPDSNEISADWSAYPILGANKDQPEWSGPQVAAGTWDDANDGMVKLMGLKVTVPKAELQKYLGRQVELRYRFANESGYDLYSDPSVKLKIEP